MEELQESFWGDLDGRTPAGLGPEDRRWGFYGDVGMHYEYDVKV